jgi:glycosyltransferase involved in cell wall biosynthesis
MVINHEPREVIEVSIIIPCLNEEKTLPHVLAEIRSSFARSGINYEVIVADNGSSDRSREVARSYGVRVVQIPTRGYGSALRGGIDAAEGIFVIMGDADGSYVFGDAIKMLPLLRSGSDIVMGNRFGGGIEEGAMPFLHRHFGNPVLSALGRMLFRVKVRDFHCGLRAFNRNRVISLGLNSSGMEFASEMIVLAAREDFRISEVNVRLKKDLRDRSPHLKTWRDGWRHLRFLLSFSPSWVFLAPAVLSALFGLTVLILSIFGPVSIGQVEFSYRTGILATSVMNVSLVASWSFLIAKSLVDKRINRGRFVTEVLGALSLLIFVIGVALIVRQVADWQESDFGVQPLGRDLLEFIAAGFCLTTGGASFFLAMLVGTIRSRS